MTDSTEEHSVVATYKSHSRAAAAIRSLQDAGIDMKRLSIVGKDFRETARLSAGDEYLDLEHLDRGVRRAPVRTAMGTVLAKNAVAEATWSKILTQLVTPLA